MQTMYTAVLMNTALMVNRYSAPKKNVPLKRAMP
jgi:hypothetical protein